MECLDSRVKQFHENLKYSFKDSNILNTVLRRIENLNSADEETLKWYERLELLGDGVLNMVISDMLFRHFPSDQSSALSIKKSKLVSSMALVNVGESIGLPLFIKPNANYGRTYQSLMENSVEALIGAIYIDGGFSHAKDFILSQWGTKINDISSVEKPKTLLNIWTTKNNRTLPRYEVLDVIGKDHDARVKACVTVDGYKRFCAIGNTRREAEENAAKALLEEINSN